MYKKLTLTLTGIIALAITGSIGLSSSVYAQNNTSNPEIIQETEPNTNNNNRNQNPPNSDGNERIIIVPSYPRDRSYPSNDDARFFDYSRSQRGRNFYESLMEPYHQRYELNRQNSNRLYNYRQYNRPSYSPYNRPYYRR